MKQGPPQCDHTLIRIKTPVKGYWIDHVRPNGDTEECFTDEIVRKNIPKTGICLDCGKRMPNPNY
jgi:hypothetical protein